MDRQTEIETVLWIDRQRLRRSYGQTDRDLDGPMDRQTEIETVLWIDRQRFRRSYGQTDRD